MSPDVFLPTGILGAAIGAVVIAYCLFDRYRSRRPYLAAHWDDEAGDWVNDAPHDVGPDPLLLLDQLTAHLKAYAAEIADLYEPVGVDDHTTEGD
ncbi:hypothetical protein ACFZC6_02055 [Streptomyces ossamyceticus]|uniref:hypothetical protein n=1 Tax=Streptomyces ossamyceticus TaxID=249581 RepID=UPI0036E178B4